MTTKLEALQRRLLEEYCKANGIEPDSQFAQTDLVPLVDFLVSSAHSVYVGTVCNQDGAPSPWVAWVPNLIIPKGVKLYAELPK